MKPAKAVKPAKAFMIKASFLSLILISLNLLGCASDSTDLVDPPATYGLVETKSGTTTVEFNPRVDILFVIDDSQSMAPHQQRLVKNIQYFVDEFAKYDVIDFHIGAVSVWDSERFRTPQNPEGVVPEISVDGSRNFYPKGQLHSLALPADIKTLPAELAGKNYVSRSQNFTEILRSTLSISPKCHQENYDCETPLIEVNGKKVEEGRGANDEELFSPVKAVLTNTHLANSANKGFRRPDAHLVIIFITDADDSPNGGVNASELYSILRKETKSTSKEQNFSVYGVYHGSDIAETTICPKDKSAKTENGGAQRLEEFFDLTRAEKLNICADDYGSLLSEIGTKIRRKAFAKKIPLPFRPEHLETTETYIEETEDGPVEKTRHIVKWLEVVYGKDQIIPADPEKGWTYDPPTNTVILHEGLELISEKGAGISIRYTPVHMANRKAGRAPSL